MIHVHKLFIVGLFVLTAGSINASAQSFPQRYDGELDVCGKVSAGMKEGKSLEAALIDLFLSYSDQSTPAYRSIQRAIIYNAIQGCHYDGGDVVRAALRIDMNLPLLVLSMSESGVGLETLSDALQQAGLSLATINDAVELATVEGQTPSPGYAYVLPPPFEVFGGGGSSGTAGNGGGLGQASPFIP
ncbi:MAG TPA: hypothetical protein VIL61_10440 [Nitrospiria bacterium]